MSETKRDYIEAARDKAVRDMLVKALEGVQFSGPRLRCPICKGQPVSGHTDVCIVGRALKVASSEFEKSDAIIGNIKAPAHD